MHPKSELLSAVMTNWMLAAVTSAALPILHAVPQLQAAGKYLPLLAALAIGLAVALTLSLVARRLCNAGWPTKQTWESLEPKQAAVLGIICWGLPVGLMFVVNEFLQSSDPIVVIPALVIWSLAGIAFGLTIRWSARKGHAGSKDS